MAVVTVKLVEVKDGTKLKVTAAGVELYSERIYNRPANARKAAQRLVGEINAYATVGAEVAALKG